MEEIEHKFRLATVNDIPSLVILEEKTWPAGLQQSKEALAHRLSFHPNGQFVCTIKEQVVAALYSQVITGTESITTGQVDFRSVSKLHSPSGHIVMLLALNVLPAFQVLELGSKLLQHCIQLWLASPDVKQVVGVTRPSKFPRYKDKMTFDEFIHARSAQGQLYDSVLSFHETHGAVIKQSLPNYRPPDDQNAGNGVLVQYDLEAKRAKK